MGLIQSIFCSAILCIERVLTWTCCAFLLVLVMFTLVVMMVYGVSVGYHYAQKELAEFAAESRALSPAPPSLRRAASARPVVRLLAVNRTQGGHPVDDYRTSKPDHIFIEPTITPLIILETERVLTWTCCAFMLMFLMFTVVILMIYGIAVGYHYAQKELASFAISAKSTTEQPLVRRAMGPETLPVVRLVAVNRSEVERAPPPLLEVYRTSKPKEHLYMDAKETPIIVLETESPPRQPELSDHERELARKLIGRFRRSKNGTEAPFLRPLAVRNGTNVLRFST